MSRILLILCLTSFFALNSPVLANDNVLSGRLNNPISVQEKIYFNLFPKINDFTSADVARSTDGQIEIKIYTLSKGSAPDTVYHLNKSSESALKKVIEEYESIVNYDTVRYLEIDWNKDIHSLLSPAMRFSIDKYKKFEIKDKKGNLYSGYLIWVDSLCVILTNNKFDWKNTNESNTHLIFYNQIEEVNSPLNIEFKGLKSIYDINLSKMQSYSPFIEQSDIGDYGMPPELYKIKMKHQSEFPKSVVDSSILRGMISEKQNKLHVIVDYNPSLYFQFDNSILLQYYGYITEIEPDGRPFTYEALIGTDESSTAVLKINTPSAAIEYNLTDKLCLGVRYSYYSNSETPFVVSIKTEGSSYTLYLSYVKSINNPYSSRLTDHVEIAYQAGILFGSLSNEANYSSSEYKSYKRKLTFNNDLLGLQSSLRFSYYFNTYVSLDFSIYLNLLQSQTFPEWNLGSDGTKRVYKQQSSIQYSGGGFNFGLGFHI